MMAIFYSQKGMSVIPATQEPEAGGCKLDTTVEANTGKGNKTLSQKQNFFL
jgi:hypothetical protein